MQLGKHIKQLRHEKSLSQEKLAEMVYVSRQTISNWENVIKVILILIVWFY